MNHGQRRPRARALAISISAKQAQVFAAARYLMIAAAAVEAAWLARFAYDMVRP